MNTANLELLCDSELEAIDGGNPLVKLVVEAAKWVASSAAGDFVLGFIDGMAEGDGGCHCSC